MKNKFIIKKHKEITKLMKLVITLLVLSCSLLSLAEPKIPEGEEKSYLACSCSGEPEKFCQLNDKEFFIGSCSGPNKRIFGKTFNSNGSIFEGAYTEGNSYHFGTLEWSDGNKIKGEFNINPEHYKYPQDLDPNNHIVIGEYLLGTITSRGFFILGEDGLLKLASFGTKFNTNPDEGWTYEASFFEEDEPMAETLLTLSVDEYKFAMWFDITKGKESNVYAEENGNKTVIDSDGETISQNWDSMALEEVNRISDKLNLSRKDLEVNFNILDARMNESLNQGSQFLKIIKPLSLSLIHISEPTRPY